MFMFITATMALSFLIQSSSAELQSQWTTSLGFHNVATSSKTSSNTTNCNTTNTNNINTTKNTLIDTTHLAATQPTSPRRHIFWYTALAD
jgi:hypothetical protein